MNRSVRIVVAEDEADTRQYLQEVLVHLGHQVVAAANGKQLVELCKTLNPDLIVTDIKMPDLDGIEAALQVNQERPTPVVLISAHHEAELLARAGAGPVMAYLVKPVKQEDVEAAIHVALSRFEQFDALRREASDLRQALEDRKVIERAKGAVMRRLGVDEQEAFTRLRKSASDNNRKLVDVARTVLGAEEVFRTLGEAERPPARPTRHHGHDPRREARPAPASAAPRRAEGE